MLVGYMRVSTEDQNLDLQQDALKAIGCEKIFQDKISGIKVDRPGFEECLSFLRDGQDTLVVWRLDRLGRSLSHLIEVVKTLEARQIGFRSLQESIDTTTSVGKLVFHIFGAIAEFEKDLIRERTMAGLKAARARGRLGGRPKKLTAQKEKMLEVLLSDPRLTIKEISQQLGVSASTLYHYEKKPTREENSP